MLRSPLLKLIILSIALLTIIWGIGPYLAFAGKHLFSGPLSQMIASLLIIIAWCALALFYLLRRFFNPPLAVKLATTNIQLKCQTKALTEHFQDLKVFLSKRHSQNLCKAKYPWILVLGPKSAGKTQLLNHANLQHAQTQTTANNDSIKPTQLIDYWVNSQALFIDTSGELTINHSQDNSKLQFWFSLMKLIKRYHHHRALDGILLVIDFPTLSQVNSERYQQTLAQFSQYLELLRDHPGKLPITLIITQADRIKGFDEYFSNLTEAERQQGFGIEFHADKACNQASIQKQLNKFIQQLNQRLIWRLHHEQSINRRNRIQEFPLQMEKITNILEHLLHQLPWHKSNALQGVYFTSSQQDYKPIDLLAEDMQHNFQTQKSQLNYDKTDIRKKNYFIETLFQKSLIHHASGQGLPVYQQRLRLFAVPIALTAIILLTWVWHQSYQHNLLSLSAMQQQLGANQNITPTTNVNLSWLTGLNRLNHTVSASHDSTQKSYHWLGLGQAQHLHNTTLKMYQLRLRTTFQPYLQHILTYTIQQNLAGNKLLLYQALKIYLAINSNEIHNKAQITDWFKSYWQRQYPQQPQLIYALSQHLQQLLALPTTWPTNRLLISKAQQQLNQLPLPDIALLTLMDHYFGKQVSILVNAKPMAGIDLKSAKIPAFYASQNFSKIYNQLIPGLAERLSKGNPVLGKKAIRLLNKTQAAQLTKAVRALYLDFHAKHWLNLIST
ncbi:MAG: 50S ribosome-binding GTPase [Gammaproteobacteria bacterium]|nr:50S ribosome-binding GTPase [Gammaproteobacteria bacterium]